MDYAVILVTLVNFRHYYESKFPDFQKRFNLRGRTPLNLSDKEAFYDWTVRNAFNIILDNQAHAGVQGHYRHDLYRCIYDELKFDIECEVLRIIHRHKLLFLKGECVKILVAGDNVFIARGILNVKQPI